jgi:RecB family exonuclease
VFLVLLIFLVGVPELAWRIGVARSRKISEPDKQSGTVKSAVLALLGLLLGFSFALAAARHDARRELVVEEANSIGTTARRAQLLPEPHATNVAELLREYISLRIQAHREAQFSERFLEARKGSVEIQDRIWSEAVAAAAER